MWINFYKVSKEAVDDYKELCYASVKKIKGKNKNATEQIIESEIKRKIRRACNLGMEIDDNGNGVKVIKYFDLLFMLNNYKVIYIYKDEFQEPYIVSEEDKQKYNWLERKLTENKQSKDNTVLEGQ